MTYSTDLRNSALRHLKAAEGLHEATRAGSQPGGKAVSGYLFGLAGELAVKEMMRQSGMKPMPPSQHRDDPFYAHFPDLKRLLKDSISGRRQGELARVANSNKAFGGWHTNMRYAPTNEVKSSLVADWREQAHELVVQMENP